MDKRAAVVLGAIFGSLFLILLAFMFLAYFAVRGESPVLARGAGPKIGVVELKGVIEDARPQLEALHDFAQDDSIKAIVVRVDSPGGAVGPAQEIHRAILRAREKKKVVASMGTLAASGGYYVSVAADAIVASAGTLTGSIGVISQFPYYGELVDWAKVDFTTIKSGALKDAGSPLRPMTEEERAYFQALVDEVHRQFVADVAKGRNLPEEKVREVADGRVLTGSQALELKLVDKIGNLYDAADEARALAGAEGAPRLVYPEKKDRFNLRMLLEEGARAVVGEVTPRIPRGLLYYWPGWAGR